MKNFTYILLLLFFSFGYSQPNIILEPFDSFQSPETKIFLNKTRDSIIAKSTNKIVRVSIWSIEGPKFDYEKSYKKLESVSITTSLFPIGYYMVIYLIYDEKMIDGKLTISRNWVVSRFKIH